MAALVSAKKLLGLGVALLLAFCGVTACAAELVGRVVDAVDARVFAGAAVRARSSGPELHTANTDTLGFFRMSGLTPGAYLLDVHLPDGRGFVARLVLLPNRNTQFLELDYSRIVPPEDDEHY